VTHHFDGSEGEVMKMSKINLELILEHVYSRNNIQDAIQWVKILNKKSDDYRVVSVRADYFQIAKVGK
jgi:copper(I)-binding protein